MGNVEIIILVVIFTFFSFNLFRMSKSQTMPLELYNKIPHLLSEGKLIGLDVRSPAEVARNSGYKAQNIPLGELTSSLEGLDRDKIYVVFCESGGRASFAINRLKKSGFEKVYSLGTWRKWNEAASQSKENKEI